MKASVLSLLLDDKPENYIGGKANSVGVCGAITGSEVLMARSQFKHWTSSDVIHFFEELLAKLDQKYPEGFTFIGDNEGIYAEAMELFKNLKYHRHTVIPNPRYSPFLNAIEYFFNQLEHPVKRQQAKTLEALLESIQKSFEEIQPSHLLNYHKTVHAFLLQCLRKEPIHSWRIKLKDEKAKTTETVKQKWDVKHKTVFATEKETLVKPLIKDSTINPVKKNKAVMIKEVPIYPDN